MYESFFGFQEKPFSLLPDPGLFYPSQIHREALTLLEYGLYNQAGFTVVTGEIGSGKTTLMRYLLERLEQDMTVGLISHTHQSFGRVVDWICAAFDVQAPRDDRIAQHQSFVDFLLAQYAQGRKTLLIIDEAQNLDRDALEEIRLLSNVNSERDILLQLLLLGQPELRDQLRQPGLEQFIQRISASYHLGRLSLEDSCRYIRHRLKGVGGRPDIFTPEACHAIYHYSQGIPRLINLICDTALVFAYGAGEQHIDGRAIDTFVRSDGSHLLFAIDGEEIEPLPEYRPILVDELEAESRDAKEPQKLEGMIRTTSTESGLGSSRDSICDSSKTSQSPRSDTENIVPRLHTATSPPRLSDALSSFDYSGWSSIDRAPEFDRSRSAGSKRHGRRLGWAITAMVIGVMGIGLVGWHILQSGLKPSTNPIEILVLDMPEQHSPLAAEGSEPITVVDTRLSGATARFAPATEQAPDTPPFDVLIKLAQEPSGPEVDAVAVEESAAIKEGSHALSQLESRLAELSVQVERLTPNHIRADFSHLIQFRDGSVALDEPARALLARFAALLKEDEQIQIHVVTHTDSQGAVANNRVLSERRAADIALILRLEGIAGSRVTHEGKGMSEPKFTPEEERRLGPWINRRIEIDLIETDNAR
jgi:general secretion pathway protein A